MVDAVIADPFKIPPLMFTQEELFERLSEWVAAGRSEEAFFAEYAEVLRKNVFGHDYKVDPKTNLPLEQGLGSPQNETLNSVQAYERWGKSDPNYERNLARKQQNLIECQERRAKAAKAKGTLDSMATKFAAR
jgi:hypothetical protein